jgi:hypothetical protein
VGIPRSTYYYKLKKKPPDIDLSEVIEKIALDFPPMATEGLQQNYTVRNLR